MNIWNTSLGYVNHWTLMSLPEFSSVLVRSVSGVHTGSFSGLLVSLSLCGHAMSHIFPLWNEPSPCELIWSDHDFRLISEFEPHKIASRFSRQIKHFRAPCARIWLVWGHGSSQVLYWHHGRVWSSSSTMQATRWWWQKGPMFWFWIKCSQIKFLSSFLFGIPSPKSLFECRL